jgi:hypothetical protein
MKHQRKRSKKTTEDGKISHAHGLAESIEWKWLYYQKQATCSMQFPTNPMTFITEIEKSTLKFIW